MVSADLARTSMTKTATGNEMGHFAKGVCIRILSGYIPAAHGVFGTMEDTQTISREALMGCVVIQQFGLWLRKDRCNRR
jgi:hypothetical protein